MFNNGAVQIAKRERFLFRRYNRSHPHFKRNLFLDALVSCLLVVVLFAEINHVSEHQRLESLKESGAIAMNANELVDYVTSHNLDVYWIGPAANFKYTLISTNKEELILSYIPQNSSLSLAGRFNLAIETYTTEAAKEGGSRMTPQNDKDDFITADGKELSGNMARPQLSYFPIEGTNKYVEVQYPTDTRGLDLTLIGARLKLISKS